MKFKNVNVESKTTLNLHSFLQHGQQWSLSEVEVEFLIWSVGHLAGSNTGIEGRDQRRCMMKWRREISHDGQIKWDLGCWRY